MLAKHLNVYPDAAKKQLHNQSHHEATTFSGYALSDYDLRAKIQELKFWSL